MDEWQNLGILKEIGAEKHNGDDKFYTRSGNMAVLWIHNASGNNYRNSSFIVDEAMGQIPCFTKRISGFKLVFQRQSTVYGGWSAMAMFFLSPDQVKATVKRLHSCALACTAVT